MRRTRRRTARNQGNLTEIESAIKAVRGAAEGPAARAALGKASSLLDRAAAKNLMHHRKASRIKSRLTSLVNGKFPKS